MAGLVFHRHPAGGMPYGDAIGQARLPRHQRIQLRLVAMQDEAGLGMAQAGLEKGAYDGAWAGIAAHGINRDCQGARHAVPFGRKVLGLCLHDFAVIIMAAGTADMVRQLGLAAIGAVAMGDRRQGMV